MSSSTTPQHLDTMLSNALKNVKKLEEDNLSPLIKFRLARYARTDVENAFKLLDTFILGVTPAATEEWKYLSDRVDG